MLLTISLTRHPATDLGYLLHKHPAKVQEVEIKSGVAHLFYPEATDGRTTCALLMELDPVGLVRTDNPRGDAFALAQYVNDRPYVSSSFLSTAIVKAFSSAMNGKCKDKPELVDELLPLECTLSVASVRGGDDTLERMFAPLGYTVEATRHALDEQFPEWGASRYHTVALRGTVRLRDLLSHLFILLPVLDGDKHYWASHEEVDKLIAKGEGWLHTHPERDWIVRRYLRYQKSLAESAIAQMTELNSADETAEEADEQPSNDRPATDQQPSDVRPPRLHDARLQTVADALVETGAASVIDLGCGEGRLLKLLWPKSQFRRLAGMDVSPHALEVAADRLSLHRQEVKENPRLALFQGSLMYADARLKGYDAAALVEVIEHLEEDRLKTAGRVVFGLAQPGKVIVTTPNREWNQIFGERAEKMRHADHRFEWTRAEFAAWCESICAEYRYRCDIRPVGDELPDWGAPTQMAIFTKTQDTHNDAAEVS